jgi:hypothetical protein
MGNKFAAGYKSIAECDRCGFRYKLSQLQKLVVKNVVINTKVCPQCWDPDQPQLKLGLYPVDDPQAVREPRPDLTTNQLNIGSRDIQWGWNPVGFGNGGDNDGLAINRLVGQSQVGSVTVTTS